MTLDDLEEMQKQFGELPIPATPGNIALARKFLLQKWQERARNQNKSAVPEDLTDSCKFTSQFAMIVFGGYLQGNPDHQFIRLNSNDKILDLNRNATDVRTKIKRPHKHDEEFFGNPEHEESMASCRSAVVLWIEEFVQLLRARRGMNQKGKQVQMESTKPGLFVGVKFSPKTVQSLAEYVRDNHIEPAETPDSYHTTIIFSRNTKFPFVPKRFDPALVIPASELNLELFGDAKNVLVITYDSSLLDAMHWELRYQYKIPWDYPEFRSHVSLTDYKSTYSGDIGTLPKPDFDLEIVAEYIKDFE